MVWSWRMSTPFGIRIKYCAFFVAFLLFTVDCGSSAVDKSTTPKKPTFFTAKERPVCLVLSVGVQKGLAHIGAIEAVKEAGLKIECVVGNSMGALIGSLYVTAPEQDLRERYRSYFAAYKKEFEKAAGTRGLIGFLGGLLLAPVTGGATLTIVAAAGGAAIGYASTPQLDHERVVRVLNDFYRDIKIEELPITFSTSYINLKQTKLEMERTGNLSKAVGKSIGNPLIFPGFDAIKYGYIDPALDRASSTPIQDACEIFPRSRILAINVTNEPAYYARDLPCPVLEVPITLPEISIDAMQGEGRNFELAVASGRLAVERALHRRMTDDSKHPIRE